MSTTLVWFHLYDAATGQPFKGTSASSIMSSSLVVPVVDQFRDAVKGKHSNKLSSVDAADLLVYKNKATFDKRNADEGKEEPLKSSSSLHGLGNSKREALIIAIPNVSNTIVWYRFVDSFKSQEVTSISLAPTATTVGDFKALAYSLNGHFLSGVSLDSLKVYLNMRHYKEKTHEALESRFPLHNLGNTQEEALILWYPIQETVNYRLQVLEKETFFSQFQLLFPASTSKSSKSSLQNRQDWLIYYGMSSKKDTRMTKRRHCHLLGSLVPAHYTACSHLFQRRWAVHAKQFGLDDVHSPENLLILLKIFEEAFDGGRLIFLTDKTTNPVTIRCKILDQALGSQSLHEAMKNRFSNFNPEDIDFKDKVCFNDLDGQELQFLNSNRPRTRFLVFHARIARKRAIERGWITQDDLLEIEDNDLWSDDFQDFEFVKRIKEWTESLPSFSPIDIQDSDSIIPPLSSLDEVVVGGGSVPLSSPLDDGNSCCSSFP
jgi:hypothetical protein